MARRSEAARGPMRIGCVNSTLAPESHQPPRQAVPSGQPNPVSAAW
jgi:hypothetical protein